MKNTIKLVGGLDPELSPSSWLNPREALMQLEDKMGNTPMTRVKIPDGMTNALLTVEAKRRFQAEFGKYLPDDAKFKIKEAQAPRKLPTREPLIISGEKGRSFVEQWDGSFRETNKNEAFKPLQLLSPREEELGLDSKFYSITLALEKQVGLENWKRTNRINRTKEEFLVQEETQKVNGKWDESLVYELPPLLKTETTIKINDAARERLQLDADEEMPDLTQPYKDKLGKVHVPSGMKMCYAQAHEPSRYILKLKDGTTMDLSKPFKDEKGKVHLGMLTDNPNTALRHLGTRLGLSGKGGAYTLLNRILGTEGVVPSYTTVWQNQKWVTIVGYHANPKDTQSNYLMAGGQMSLKGKLSKAEEEFYADHPEMDDRTDKVMSVSDVDYNLLKGAADTPVKAEPTKDEDGEDAPVITYLDGDEYDVPELELSDYRETINLDNVDEDEGNLMSFLRSKMDFSQFQQGSWGLLESQEADDLLIGEKDLNSKGELVWKTGVRGAKHRVETAKMLIGMNGPTPDLVQFLEQSEASVVYYQGMLRARRRILCNNDLTEFISHQEPGNFNMRGTENGTPLKEPCKFTPNMALSPTNEVVAPPIKEGLTKPKGRVSIPITGKVGETIKVITKAGIRDHVITGAPRVPISASNASKTLKRVLHHIAAQDPQKAREASAQAEFDRAFEAQLAS